MSFKATITRHQAMIESLFALEPQVTALAARIASCVKQGNKILFFGNGGSASDAQHLAAEFVVRYHKDRRPYGAIALTTDTSILTAHSNDYQFDTVFDRQIAALGRPGDIAIGLSTSGNSGNVINGIKTAKEMGIWSCAFTGEGGGKLAEIADEYIAVPVKETARVQEGHILIGHWLCETLDETD
ncbi:MAG: SIS domain-containing protein [Pseudomonadota bacterium]|uniref:Phosphoheptose isomerase n=3 Tax=Methylophaga TaxID=40222 RepID=A0ABQ5TY86_9GAMM|nr:MULTISPECIES: SIS domain-containing protein [Methylophaga]MEC9411479.1 SIS domain-containing protein [Pseudomonadota bacterium]GLQ00994.1 phosphoheptose isomerase [Methylophaga thalassica]HIM38787.1 SIS domain-containing protein [Methylophaga aminisulfidivorans]